MRPDHAAINGESGLLRALEKAFADRGGEGGHSSRDSRRRRDFAAIAFQGRGKGVRASPQHNTGSLTRSSLRQAAFAAPSQGLIPKRSAGPRATKIGVVSLNALDRHRPNREEPNDPHQNQQRQSITLSDRFYDGVVMEGGVLSIDPLYFGIRVGRERWIYRVARKHAGGARAEGFAIALPTLR